MDYEKVYMHLFNCITDALTELEHQNLGRAKEILEKAQQYGEDVYIEAE